MCEELQGKRRFEDIAWLGYRVVFVGPVTVLGFAKVNREADGG